MTVRNDLRWSGIFPSLCTSFAEDESIDEVAQRAVVRFVLACKVHGLVCGGLAGEVNRLTPDERKRLCEAVLAEAGGAVPVLVGVGAEASHTAVDLARHAERAGADGIVIPPPVTTRVSAEVLAGYFLSVAGSTTLPVMIQDAPAYLGVALSPDFVTRLADCQPNIRYVKVESGPEETAQWVRQLGPAVGVFTGDAGLHLLSCLRAGAAGNVPGSEIADRLVMVYDAERRGNAALADRLHGALLPFLVFGLQTLDHYNACSKEVLVRRGVLRRAGLRRPAPGLAPQAHALLEKCLAEAGLDAGLSESASIPSAHTTDPE